MARQLIAVGVTRKVPVLVVVLFEAPENLDKSLLHLVCRDWLILRRLLAIINNCCKMGGDGASYQPYAYEFHNEFHQVDPLLS
jgi:hypothetical protein